MPTSSLGFDNFYSTTLSSSISDTDTTIPVTSPPTATEGYLVIEPETAANREIIYYTGVSGNNVTLPSVAAGRGVGSTSAIAHASGATVKMNVTAEHFDYLRDLFNTTEQGWTALTGTHSVSSTYNSGNRSFNIATSVDHSSILSPGMRYRVTRNTTPPTQCADLEASSSHYASKASPTGINLTTTVSCEAWVKLESYVANGTIVSQYNTTGFMLRIDNGQVALVGKDAGTSDTLLSYQSIPLNKWVHVAATLTINTGGSIYIDGVNVPASYTNGTSTAITEAGDLEVGSLSGGLQLFDGKLADVRVWSDIRTATEIQDNMYAYPSDTTGLVAHFKLNGDFTDASSNGNDLTAQNSAVATNADNPWNATEYGIITAVSASDIQVFCPEGYGIPNETLTAPYYSTQSAPFGFPRGRDKWVVETIAKTSSTTNNPTQDQWYATNYQIEIPIGSFHVSYHMAGYNTNEGTLTNDMHVSLSTSSSSESDAAWTSYEGNNSLSTPGRSYKPYRQDGYLNLTASDIYYLVYKTGQTGMNVINVCQSAPGFIRAECAFL